MTAIQENNPDHIAAAAQAARARFSGRPGREFRWTGIVGPSVPSDEPLQRILCGTPAGHAVASGVGRRQWRRCVTREGLPGIRAVYDGFQNLSRDAEPA